MVKAQARKRGGYSMADIIALLMDLAEQYPQYADYINQIIEILQGWCG